MRCLTLADALKKHGVACYFICREHPGHLLELVKSRGHKTHPLPIGDSQNDAPPHPTHAHWLGIGWREDANQTLSYIKGLDIDWLIIDHYALDILWEEQLRTHCKKLMVIDDLADRNHTCDLLLDQTLDRQAESYKNLVPPGSRLLLGAEYALLRPEFAALRADSLKRRQHSNLKKLLIFMGGMDQDNSTGQILSTLAGSQLPEDVLVCVVMSSRAPWLEQIEKQALASHLNVRVYVDVKNMASLMAECNLAIGAGGSTSWERCCLGLPTILFVTAKNQITIASNISRKGAGINLGEITPDSLVMLQQTIAKLQRNPESLASVIKSASACCDGQGVYRVLNTLEEESHHGQLNN